MRSSQSMAVSRVMRSPPVTVTPDRLVVEACQRMIEADAGSVIVVSDVGEPLGIIIGAIIGAIITLISI